MRPNSFRKLRPGMSLLELMLALALTVIIMAAISLAMTVQMRTLDRRQTQVETAQLGRALLTKISNDLTRAIVSRKMDFSGIASLAQTATSALGTSLDGTLGTDLTAGLGTDLESMLTEDPSSSLTSTSIAESTIPPPVPGLYGNQFELQVDVSRVPRREEYLYPVMPVAAGEMPDILSDVKTVAYFLAPDSTGGALGDPADQARVQAIGYAGRGLMRRQIDRQVALYANQGGALTVQNQPQGEMLAEEVTGLEFGYFDGTQWLTEWDSQLQKGLPVAVAITIQVDTQDPNSLEAQRAFQAPTTLNQSPNSRLFQMVVRLPAGETTEERIARSRVRTQGLIADTQSTNRGNGGGQGNQGDQGDGGDDQGGQGDQAQGGQDGQGGQGGLDGGGRG